MDVKQMQDLFRATDDGDAQRLKLYLHPELELTMIGVEGVDAPKFVVLLAFPSLRG